jgi:hypothetical protein
MPFSKLNAILLPPAATTTQFLSFSHRADQAKFSRGTKDTHESATPEKLPM